MEVALVFVHGFRGDDERTFQGFPEDLAWRIKNDSGWTVTPVVYPTYPTEGAMDEATTDLYQWLCSNYKRNSKVILLGHSMGGYLAADVARRNEQYSYLSICGVIAFDTPYYGIHPQLIQDYIAKVKAVVRGVEAMGEELFKWAAYAAAFFGLAFSDSLQYVLACFNEARLGDRVSGMKEMISRNAITFACFYTATSTGRTFINLPPNAELSPFVMMHNGNQPDIVNNHRKMFSRENHGYDAFLGGTAHQIARALGPVRSVHSTSVDLRGAATAPVNGVQWNNPQQSSYGLHTTGGMGSQVNVGISFPTSPQGYDPIFPQLYTPNSIQSPGPAQNTPFQDRGPSRRPESYGYTSTPVQNPRFKRNYPHRPQMPVANPDYRSPYGSSRTDKSYEPARQDLMRPQAQYHNGYGW